MIHHLNRAAGLCLTAALLLTAAGCGQQTVPESPSPSPVVKTAAADKNDLTVVRRHGAPVCQQLRGGLLCQRL
ncbi:MAG: hypothetical protein ACLRNQ_14590 [Flavonifractor plautii]